MDGYYPIQAYCALTGISKDTAYHRAIRGNIKSVKDKRGRLYLYFSENENNVPDGFISVNEYAKKYNMKAGAVQQAIRHKRFNEEDVFRLQHNIGSKNAPHVFIRETAELAPGYKTNCPPKYIHVSEWAKLNNVTRNNLGQMIITNRIETIKVGGYRYIKEGTPLPKDRRRE
jgi:hypothetical protein